MPWLAMSLSVLAGAIVNAAYTAVVLRKFLSRPREPSRSRGFPLTERTYMKVDLPSGGWAELRDNLKGRDRIAARKAVKLRLKDEVTTIDGDVEEQIGIALLSLLVTSWSFEGVPAPAVHVNPAGVLEDLDLDDLNALLEAVTPLLEKVSPRPNRQEPRG